MKLPALKTEKRSCKHNATSPAQAYPLQPRRSLICHEFLDSALPTTNLGGESHENRGHRIYFQRY